MNWEKLGFAPQAFQKSQFSISFMNSNWEKLEAYTAQDKYFKIEVREKDGHILSLTKMIEVFHFLKNVWPKRP